MKVRYITVAILAAAAVGIVFSQEKRYTFYSDHSFGGGIPTDFGHSSGRFYDDKLIVREFYDDSALSPGCYHPDDGKVTCAMPKD